MTYSQPSTITQPKINEYTRRINRVLDHLANTNYQQQDLNELAEIAHFSPFHFHRIFKALMKESLYKYIQRMRLEKATHLLKYQKKTSITNIALELGFTSSATFARAFKAHFGISASQWRSGTHQQFSKNRNTVSNNSQQHSNHWQVISLSPLYIHSRTKQPNWRLIMKDIKDIAIEVKQVPEKTVAYIRHIGEFKGETSKWNQMFERLITWGASKELISCPGTDYFTVFRDDLTVSQYDNFKADVCMSVPKDTEGTDEICIGSIATGLYAVAYFEINGRDIEQAWQSIYSHWLPNSGYLPDDRSSFERYLNDPKLHPENKLMLEIYIPVKPL